MSPPPVYKWEASLCGCNGSCSIALVCLHPGFKSKPDRGEKNGKMFSKTYKQKHILYIILHILYY